MRTALRLDAREPYLDHHRPGVLPLLGTAMGVALLSRIAVPLLDEADADTEPGRNLVISDVRIGPALQVAGSGAEVAVSATTSVEIGGPMVHAELSSAIEAPAVVHYQAAFASERSAPAHRSGRGAIRDGDTVDADHIYELFFHGPAFRVLAAAGLAGGAMVARASAVPALTRQPAPVDPVGSGSRRAGDADRRPSGGGHETTDDDPGVDCTRRVRPAASALDAELTARATRIGTGDAFDIDVFTDARRCLSIIGYATRPLPFPAPSGGVERLADEFARRTTDR